MSFPTPRLLLIKADERTRADVEAVAVGFAVDLFDTMARARPYLRSRRYFAWIVCIDDAHDLVALRGARTAPVLVVSRVGDLRITNRTHLLRAECVFAPRIRENVRVFLELASERAPRSKRGTVREAERLAKRGDLGERQRDVLLLIAHGVPRSQLADRLNVAENTVKTAVRMVLRKLGAKNVVDLRERLLERR